MTDRHRVEPTKEFVDGQTSIATEDSSCGTIPRRTDGPTTMTRREYDRR